MKIAGQASGQLVPFSGPAVEALLTELLDVQDEQVKRLRSIEDQVQRLVDGPWKAGRGRIEEAAIPNRSPEVMRQLLIGAADNFRDAAPLQPDPSFSMAQVRLDLAMTVALLGDRTAMLHHAQAAYITARRTLWMMVEQYARSTRSKELSGSQRKQLTPAGSWFEDFELGAAALGDPQAETSHAAESWDEGVTWRPGALLDHLYLTRKRAGHYRDWATYDERWADGDRTVYSLEPGPRPPGPWDEFWRQPEAIVTTPVKPPIQSQKEEEFWKHQDSGLWD